MRAVPSCLVSILLIVLSVTVSAQSVRVSEHGARGTVDEERLREEVTNVPGQGREVPGLDLSYTDTPRHAIGDGTGFADRDLVDSTWLPLRTTLDTVVPGANVHWIRYQVLADADLKGVPLILNVGAREAFEVFLNGRSLTSSWGAPLMDDASRTPVTEPPLGISIPVRLLCDGRSEVIAVRVESAAGMSLEHAGVWLSLHMSDTHYATQRRTMHFGVFVGINIVIMLLALVIWTFERGDRSWLLLAMLSLVSALDTFCDVGYGLGALGFMGAERRALELIGLLLVPWTMYLLIMVLGLLRGDLSARRKKWYTFAAITVTFICGAFGVGELSGVMDMSEGFAIVDDRVPVIVTIVALAIVLGLIVAWFALVVLRLAIGLLRSKGYARWIGGGALASSLLSVVLKVVGAISGTATGAWFTVMADYCSYVAVPVSVAVYLAIRSAHHNKLVARQRDDLDREVQERTAELEAEKQEVVRQKDRSDALLLNILPEEVADELKATGHTDAKHFDTATILFTDFKGFTEASEKLSPQELVAELNTCFEAFDHIITARGIEKIKTIGDAYMCAGGLPDPKTSSPVDVVHAALEMRAFMVARKKERDALGEPAFEMRIGIHTGPVVAGIVGVKKFQYDIWGDTVNTASRMESSGEVGQVNISASTYELVRNGTGLTFTPRGKVLAKGKGELEMYFVQ